LTSKQLTIWDLNRLGYTQADIGRKIEATRQAVYDALKISLKKVDSALRHAAEANMVEIKYVDPKNGILLGVVPQDSSQVILTFSKRHGIQTWHYDEPRCQDCKWVKRCADRLMDEAEERGVSITEEEKRLPPAKLAHTIFSELIPWLKP
jgi:hypothetical protein